jgi:ribose 5-phosphate isomerase B
MEVHCGSDHRGYELKRKLMDHLKSLGHHCTDHGCLSTEAADYPDYAKLVGEAVGAAESERRRALGIVVCGSGVGIAIPTNKMPGVRCVVAWCEHAAEYGRRHNHANVLAFGSDIQTFTQARRCLDAYLAAEEEGGRHAARVAKIMELEERPGE